MSGSCHQAAAPGEVVDHGITAWVVVLVSALYFFFEFMQMNMFNSLDPYLLEAFRITPKRLGEMSSFYFYGDVLFLFVAGMILDRFSTRRLILLAMGVSILCVYVFANTSLYWVAATCRFVTGIAAAFCLLSSVRLASRWFPAQRMALVVGLIVTMGMLGGAFAQVPVTLLLKHYGWRATLVYDAVFGLLLFVCIAFFVKDFPPGYQEVMELDTETNTQKDSHTWMRVWGVLSNIQNWVVGVYTSLLNLPIMLLGAIWGNMYLVHVHKMTLEQASFISSMIYIGMIIGSPLTGWVSDRLTLRQLPMLVGAVLSLAVILVIMYAGQLGFVELVILFFLLGLITSVQVLAYPLIAESNPLSHTGAAEGLSATLIMAGGLTQPVFGWLMQQSDGTHAAAGASMSFSVQAYNHAMLLIPIAFALSIVFGVLVKETRCKPYDSLKNCLGVEST